LKNKVLGIIGGGQLGRMIALSASHLGVKSYVFDPSNNSPAFDIASKIFNYKYDDIEAIKKFSESVDSVVYEFENIPINTAKIVESICPLRPSAKVLEISQDRLIEKEFLSNIAKVKTADFRNCPTIQDLESALKDFNYSAILKTRRFGYDGKGQIKINNNINPEEVWKTLEGHELILEKFIPFKRELSIILARSEDGKTEIYDCVQNKHKNHILDETIAPAPNLDIKVEEKSKHIALRVAKALKLIGLLAVEMFEMHDGNIIVNEIAPRPHNSGHWTMDGCVTSQFEQSVRAAIGWPLGSSKRNYDIVMKNLVGNEIELFNSYINEPNYKVYLYGKKEVRDGRKMGHINRIIKKNSNTYEFKS